MFPNAVIGENKDGPTVKPFYPSFGSFRNGDYRSSVKLQFLRNFASDFFLLLPVDMISWRKAVIYRFDGSKRQNDDTDDLDGFLGHNQSWMPSRDIFDAQCDQSNGSSTSTKHWDRRFVQLNQVRSKVR